METYSNALVGVISGLVTAIVALIGLVKFYLPRHDERLHNPHLDELVAIRKGIEQSNVNLATLAISLAGVAVSTSERHRESMDILVQIKDGGQEQRSRCEVCLTETRNLAMLLQRLGGQG